MATAPAGGGGGGGGDSQILREYLVALGFRIDEQRHKRFTNVLQNLDKTALRVGTSVVGIGTAAAFMAHQFMRSMERIGYSARYANTTVQALQGLEYAGRNAGLAGGAMENALTGMAEVLRREPGLAGLLNAKGIQTMGRNTSDILLDFLKYLKPLYERAPFRAIAEANLFGINERDLFLMMDSLPQILADVEKYKQLVKESGADADKLEASARRYMKLWRDITTQFSLFAQSVGMLVGDDMASLAEQTGTLLRDWTRMANRLKEIREGKSDQGENWGKRLWEGLTGVASGDRVALTQEQRKRIGMSPADELPIGGGAGFFSGGNFQILPQAYNAWLRFRFGQRLATDPDAVDAVQDSFNPRTGVADVTAADMPKKTGKGADPQKAAFLRQLEQQYNLPPGWLDAIWARESGRGTNPLARKPNAAGALGDFQFKEGTALDYEVDDRLDFFQSARGAARMWNDLLYQYKGDVRKATYAWNWGGRNMARKGLGNAPLESRKFADAMEQQFGANVNVNTEINVNGVTDAQKAGEVAASKQADVANDVTRNLSPRAR